MTDLTPLTKPAPASAPITLQKMAPGTARLLFRLMRITRPVSLTASQAQLMVTLEGPRPPAERQPWLHLTLDGHPAAIQISWGNLRRLHGQTLEQVEPDDAALLIEEALADFLDEAEGTTGLALRFTTLTQDPDPSLAHGVTLNVQGTGPNRSTVQARLPMRLGDAAAEVLLARQRSQMGQRPDPAGLMLRLAHEIDTITLGAGDLAALTPGQAVTISAGTPEGRLILNERLFAPVAPSDTGGLRLLAPFRPLSTSVPEDAMTDAPDTDAATALTAETLDEVEVRLSFRAGHTDMSLGELRALAPGAVIETTDDATAMVDIVANGRSIGTGELLDVGGRRAIQIRTLFTKT